MYVYTERENEADAGKESHTTDRLALHVTTRSSAATVLQHKAITLSSVANDRQCGMHTVHTSLVFVATGTEVNDFHRHMTTGPQQDVLLRTRRKQATQIIQFTGAGDIQTSSRRGCTACTHIIQQERCTAAWHWNHLKNKEQQSPNRKTATGFKHVLQEIGEQLMKAIHQQGVRKPGQSSVRLTGFRSQ